MTILLYPVAFIFTSLYYVDMGIMDRLGDLLRSYLNSENTDFSHDRGSYGDPDLDDAFAELDDFLNRDKADSGASWEKHEQPRQQGRAAPEELRPDFAELGLPLGAGPEECKAAYKKLLKLHHPDRHAGNPANMKKATEKTARLNAAFDRIEKWRGRF